MLQNCINAHPTEAAIADTQHMQACSLPENVSFAVQAFTNPSRSILVAITCGLMRLSQKLLSLHASAAVIYTE